MAQYNSKAVLNALFQGKTAVLNTSLSTMKIQNVGSTFYVKYESGLVEKLDSVGCLGLLDTFLTLVENMDEFVAELELK